ncbi:MAG: hypothetical protein ACR2L5_01570 [Candidatus Actinomarinaceae bacterium]
MKISKNSLRKIIRESLINEYQSHANEYGTDYNWAACKLDLPDGFWTSKDSVDISKAEKSASLAATFYGIPGEFCNLISAAFGDNPERGTKDVIDRGQKNKRLLNEGYFVTLNKELSTNYTAFVANTYDAKEKSEADKIAAIERDIALYEEVRINIERQSGLRPAMTGERVIDVIYAAVGIKGSMSELKKNIKIKEDQGFSDDAITEEIIFQALLMCENTIKGNLVRKNLRDFYVSGGKREYEDFISTISA